MRRADRLPFVPAAALFAAGDAWRFALALAHADPFGSVVPLLAAIGWASVAYYLWRQRTMRADLGKGRWAEIVDVDDMTHGAKMKVQLLLPDQESTEHWFVSEMRMKEMLVAQVVTNWSLELPVPNGNPAALANVPDSAYSKLVDETRPHWESLDFLRAGRTSSESRTDSTDTTSPDSSPPSEQ